MNLPTTTPSVRTIELYETLRIKFADRDEHVEISGNGEIKYDLVHTGYRHNIFGINTAVDRLQESVMYPTGVRETSEEDRLNGISHYLSLLYSAQQVGHIVNDEISEALKEFREIVGFKKKDG